MGRTISKSPFILIRPADWLWVGVCESFVQAFATLRVQDDPDNWFIVPAHEYRLVIEGKGRWVKLGDPKPMRGNSNHMPYRGPLSEADKQKRIKAKLRERKRRRLRQMEEDPFHYLRR